MSARRVDAYLERIGYDGSRARGPDALRRVHRAHMLAVPFENLDIRLGVPIELSVPAFREKIVGRRRGGFCYELNGLFAWLLVELGYRVTLLSGRVFGESLLSPEFDHLLLLVQLDRPWIADVGFGDSFLEPIELRPGSDAVQHGARYAVVAEGHGWTLRRQRPDGAWEAQYAFSLTPRRLDEFAPRARYHQTSPESHFTQRTVCSRATETGRITLSNDRYIVTEGARREEREVRTAEEYREILARDFGMDPGGLAVERLMGPRRSD